MLRAIPSKRKSVAVVVVVVLVRGIIASFDLGTVRSYAGCARGVTSKLAALSLSAGLQSL